MVSKTGKDPWRQPCDTPQAIKMFNPCVSFRNVDSAGAARQIPCSRRDCQKHKAFDREGGAGGEEAWDTGRVLKARRLSFLDSCSVQMSTAVWPFSQIQSRSPRVLDICFFQMSTRLAGSPLERPSQLMGAPIWISWASCLHICVLQLSKTIGLPAGLCQQSPTRLPTSFRQLLFPTV